MLAFAPILALLFAHAAQAATTCNGHAELCDRKYSDVTFVGSHNSAFVGKLPINNQYNSVSEQLGQGVRLLQAQTHSNSGGISLCHTSCDELDAGKLESYLATVKVFMDANPNEVVTILLTNGDGIDGASFAAAFETAGLAGLTYWPGSTLALDQWPTLGAMIDAGTRLVVFMDYPADTTVPYILDEFGTYIVETPYDTTDSSFPQCDVDRPSGADASTRMVLVNHYLDYSILGILVPNQLKASTTNSVDSITAQAGICNGNYGRNPNFILLDWISVGDGMAAQDSLNGLA